MLKLKNLRTIAVIEGTTLLLLVFIAVPLKYNMGLSVAVTALGPIHGVAFVLYIIALISGLGAGLINSLKLIVGTVAAFIPFGSFVFERYMLADQTE